jgi:hypothetical protein
MLMTDVPDLVVMRKLVMFFFLAGIASKLANERCDPSLTQNVSERAVQKKFQYGRHKPCTSGHPPMLRECILRKWGECGGGGLFVPIHKPLGSVDVCVCMKVM